MQHKTSKSDDLEKNGRYERRLLQNNPDRRVLNRIPKRIIENRSEYPR